MQWMNPVENNGSREVVNSCMLTLSSVCVFWRLDINVCLDVFMLLCMILRDGILDSTVKMIYFLPCITSG